MRRKSIAPDGRLDERKDVVFRDYEGISLCRSYLVARLLAVMHGNHPARSPVHAEEEIPDMDVIDRNNVSVCRQDF